MDVSSDMSNGILAWSEKPKMEFVVIWISLSAGFLVLYTDLLVNSPGIFGILGGSCIGVKGKGYAGLEGRADGTKTSPIPLSL